MTKETNEKTEDDLGIHVISLPDLENVDKLVVSAKTLDEAASIYVSTVLDAKPHAGATVDDLWSSTCLQVETYERPNASGALKPIYRGLVSLESIPAWKSHVDQEDLRLGPN